MSFSGDTHGFLLVSEEREWTHYILRQHELGRESSFQQADVITRPFPHAQSPLHFWMFKRLTADSMVRRLWRSFCSCGSASIPAPSFTADIQPRSCLWGWAWPFLAFLGLACCDGLHATGAAESSVSPGVLSMQGKVGSWARSGSEVVHTTRTWVWVSGPGSRRGRGLRMPCVSVFVGNELMCAKFHHTHLTYLRDYHKDSVLNASRALQAFIHGNMKFHSNLWCTSPLPHYLKCGFSLKTACIKLASASLTDIFHVWNQNTSLVTSMARIFFHVLLFYVDGREAALHSWISGNSSIALPF